MPSIGAVRYQISAQCQYMMSGSPDVLLRPRAKLIEERFRLGGPQEQAVHVQPGQVAVPPARLADGRRVHQRQQLLRVRQQQPEEQAPVGPAGSHVRASHTSMCRRARACIAVVRNPSRSVLP